MNIVTNAANAASSFLPAALYQPPLTPGAEGWSPSQMIPGWTLDNGTVSFPLASLYGLTSATGDGTTGDARQVLLSLCQTTFAWLNELDDAPTGITMTYSPGSFMKYGAYTGKLKSTFTVSAYLDYPSEQIAEEV
jgi:hypothetical protein